MNAVVDLHKPYRRRLPVERMGLSHSFQLNGHSLTITTGEYDDGSLGEFFLSVNKEGSTLSGAFDAWATSVSIGLQYNVPLTVLAEKYIGMRFEPSGFVGGQEATSICDYVFRWLMEKYG